MHMNVISANNADKTTRTTRLTEDGSANAIEVVYAFDRIIPWTPETPLDAHVLGILLYAASKGQPLYVHGTLTRTAMRNLEELLCIWCLWKPAIYKHIQIIPDAVIDANNATLPNNAIAAFSGGVDASFTALRHAKTLPEALRYPLTSLLMVHGFDVRQEQQQAFTQLTERVKPLITELGLELRTIRTNSKELGLQDWHDSFAIELAACLHMYSHEFRYGLIGSSEPYNTMVFPWGSTPVTDRLMTGDLMAIIHDGAGYSRTDKVAELAKHPTACKVLKVCWEGADGSENCGHCEKCTRTRLNFLAAGHATPACFTGPLDLKAMQNITIRNSIQLAELSSIVTYAESHNTTGHWLPKLKTQIANWKPPQTNEGRGVLFHSIVKLLDRVGLKKWVKQCLQTCR